MIDISVIVPAYNAQDYIRTCLDSILCQSKKEFEIIVVNDGSRDATLEILRDYEKNYPQVVRVFSQENQGLSVTRNNAIRQAKGKYLLFVDSDDSIKEDMLKTLYEKAVEGDYSVVASDVDCVYPDHTTLISSGVEVESTHLSVEEKKSILLNTYVVVWNKLYKRELFEQDAAFEPGIWFEDVLFFHKLIPRLESIAYVKESFYQYVQNPNSITYTYSDKLKDVAVVMDKIVEYYKEKGWFEEYRDELEYAYARYMIATFLKRLAKSKDKKRYREGVSFAMEKLRGAFPDYKKNKYLKKGLKGRYLKHFNGVLARLVFVLEKNKMN